MTSSQSSVDVVTIGESLILFTPLSPGALAHAPLFVRTVAGAESNVSFALSRLGLKVRWISRLGADPFGDIIYSSLAGEGIDVSFVERDTTAPTAVFFKENRGYGDPSVYYYRRNSAVSKLTPEDVRPSWFEGARHLHVTGITPALGAHTHEALRLAMQTAREQGLTISYDPNLRRKLWDEETARRTLLSLVPLCDILLPGLDESEFLLGTGTREEYGKRFLEMGPSLVVTKLGAEGALASTREETVHMPAYPIERVVDSVGAGDAFAAGLLSVILEEGAKLPPEPDVLRKALTRAALLGALATQVPGDWEGLPHRAEVERLEAGLSVVKR